MICNYIPTIKYFLHPKNIFATTKILGQSIDQLIPFFHANEIVLRQSEQFIRIRSHFSPSDGQLPLEEAAYAGNKTFTDFHMNLRNMSKRKIVKNHNSRY